MPPPHGHCPPNLCGHDMTPPLLPRGHGDTDMVPLLSGPAWSSAPGGGRASLCVWRRSRAPVEHEVGQAHTDTTVMTEDHEEHSALLMQPCQVPFRLCSAPGPSAQRDVRNSCLGARRQDTPTRNDGSRQPSPSPESVSKEWNCHAWNIPLCCYNRAGLGACTAALSAGLQGLPASSAISAPHPVTATGNTLSPRCLLPVPTLQHKHMEEGPGARSLGRAVSR